MKKRLFLYTTLIICAGFLCFFAASAYITYSNSINLAKDAVRETARVLAGLYSADSDLAAFVKAGENTRITVIAPDGRVLADSQPLDLASLDDHLQRPEIQAAANGSPAAYIRHSATLGVDLLYYALKAESGAGYVFIRSAIPVSTLGAYFFRTLPLLLILLLAAALLCFFFARVMIGRVTKPFESVEQKLRLLSGGGYTPEPVPGGYEEIDQIIREINEIALILQSSMGALQDERNKAEYILNHIVDGLFVVDADKNVALINSAALDIFEVNPDIKGKSLHYLTYGQTLAGAVDDCVSQEKNALFETTLKGRIFFAAVKRLPETELTMVVLSDVTESRENAKRREEFFANASHELKTPLSAIKGFNELTALHNKDAGINKYIESITRETNRMLSLIGDMLKLSELETAQPQAIDPQPVGLAKVAGEVREALSAAIEEKAITFELSGDAYVRAEAEHIYELLKNLIENAVRYNDYGGKVSVMLESAENSARLTVADDGIGISPEEQTRIFERFYRVEKSRSQKNGGTGLGLSIVKHICALYDWKLSLKSKLGLGTEVSVVFE